ncbi:modification methylase, HemK family [Kribbella flavida DSM 17836]|uniref:peptide chain release factor N(5)-glutamine methyltransferase n=1 Tax=Kribbella flavida (strain DSM 17836 / JCM 10339 / NBRC 14399) TaxID=479435 RepID=D2PMQ4_KRIFD|nr:putative protein N(5)-glutamine methyltransferase [Kribbella flavida]ADB32606.1 modification methylase, HemK family [Kribbella flavida DSM 17836]
MTALTPTSVVSTLRAAGCVFAEDEAAMILATATDDRQLAEMVEQRVAGRPLEHVVGWAEFRGLRVALDADVFVPRRRTEHLVDEAIARCRPGAVVVDLCCGSGALGLALASAVPGTELSATDVHPAAVQNARRNLAPIGGQVFEGDLYARLPTTLRGRVDLLLANVPYVPSDQVRLLPAEARLHEPLVTLDGGSDGLDLLRRVAAEASDWLVPGGLVVTETSNEQAAIAIDVFRRHGLSAVVTTDADRFATTVVATRAVPVP